MQLGHKQSCDKTDCLSNNVVVTTAGTCQGVTGLDSFVAATRAHNVFTGELSASS